MGVRYHGKNSSIRMSTSASAATAVLVGAQWSLDKSTDRVDVTSFGDTNKQSVQGLPAVKGTISAFFDSADSTMLSASESATGAQLVLYATTAHYHYGLAWIDYKLDTDINGAVKISGSFEAAGSWSHQP